MTLFLTPLEKVSCRHHLGYLNVQAAQTFILGIPAPVETSFIIEGAMDRILPEAVQLVRRHLQQLDSIEAQMVEDRELLAVDKVDEIVIRKTEMKELRVEYNYWAQALANLLGIYPNPADRRFGADGSINCPVQN